MINPYNGILISNFKKTQPADTCNKEAKKENTVYDFIYLRFKKMQNSLYWQKVVALVWSWKERWITKGTRKLLGMTEDYFYCSNGLMGIHICQNWSNQTYSFIYVQCRGLQLQVNKHFLKWWLTSSACCSDSLNMLSTLS